MPGGVPTQTWISFVLALGLVLAGWVGLSPAAWAQSDLPAMLNWLTATGGAKTAVDNTNEKAKVVRESPAPPLSQATGVEVVGDRQSTLFQLTLSRGVTAEVYSLANPYRVIIDLPSVSFRLPEEAGRTGRGLVSAFRYGEFAEGKARIVLDTTGPVAIGKAAMTNARSGGGVVLTVELQTTNAEAFGDGTGGGRQQTSDDGTALERSVETPGPKRSAAGKPVIVIDPGHGGIDPGAVGAGNLLEKNLVLSVAQKLRARLEGSGRYTVVATRSRDVFVSLNDRLKISRAAHSDLFISIHADSIEQIYASNIKGATVYTLSERASDAEAKAIAEKENASDLIAGLDVGPGEENDDVKNILIDLMKRETANFSTEFSRTLVRKMSANVTLSRDPERAAAFKVLRQTHAPSVLVELGYVSNPEESRLMQSGAWQQKVADSIAAAIDAFFAKRTVETP
jgi:N-acetylmuramoyl-L-alanine amidase